MTQNFEFLKLDNLTNYYYEDASDLERQYALENYSGEIKAARVIAENIVKDILDQHYLLAEGTFNDNLRLIKQNNFLEESRHILDAFYEIKDYGNRASHQLTSELNFSKTEGMAVLNALLAILIWFATEFTSYKGEYHSAVPPKFEPDYRSFTRKMIYSITGDNPEKFKAYVGREKVGEATITDLEIDLKPNSSDLQASARPRIQSYMGTAGAAYRIDWAELAYSKRTKQFFSDKDVHRVLDNSNIPRDSELRENGGTEWYITSVETVKSAIKAVKEGKPVIDTSVSEESPVSIKLRQEQIDAIKKTKSTFKKSQKMLWNAKMRFGKTLSALQLIKDENYQHVLIMTHRPVVSDSWFDDFNKIGMDEQGYLYGSVKKEASLDDLNQQERPYIYFASIQDLRDSKALGGTRYDKNELVSTTNWDLVIVDEAHEGTQTELAQRVFEAVRKPNTKFLELSGTPFNLLDQYDESEIFNWDYTSEQARKANWDTEHPNEVNPYKVLPRVNMYTFEMKKRFSDSNFIDEGTKSFNFHEFFKVDDQGKFVYEDRVKLFLDNISNPDSETNYPFSKVEFRNRLRHTLWLMPTVKSANALEQLLKKHGVFGFGYEIVNVVADSREGDDSTEGSKDDLDLVRKAISDHPGRTKSITLTVRKLTTGVNIPEWTGILFLNNTTSAMQYLQAAFRAQTPFSDPEVGMKEDCYVFDFAPDRALTIMADATKLNTGAGKLKTEDQKNKMGQLLNFLPIIGMQGNGMRPYKVDSLLTQLKKVYAEKAVRTGFDDDSIYNDELLKFTSDDVELFDELKGITGKTKAERKRTKVDVNNQGLTDEEYDEAEKAKKKSKKERTSEEIALIEKENSLKKQRKTMISILRAVSIRIPMMIYGMEVDLDEDIDINKFVDLVDQKSWEEFMPTGVTKDLFLEFTKYYDNEIFIEAGRIIRNRVKQLDKMEPLARTEKIAEIFSTFKNPDKETVLTPWRVVNMQYGKTVGGYSYYDDNFDTTSADGVNVAHWVETDRTNEAFKDDTSILEINSKTGLYPLFSANSLFYQAQQAMNENGAGKFTAEDEERVWQDILQKNIFVVAKTPMAKTITQRTLAGYKDYATNIKFIDNIVETAKESIPEAVDKVQEEFGKMKFDVVVGNPPYQEQAKGSSSGDDPIYHLFMDLSYKLAPEVILITPARFLANAGKTPKSWNEKILKDEHLKVVYFTPVSGNIFPHTDIKGGVVITQRDERKILGPIGTFTRFSELSTILNKVNSSHPQSLSESVINQNRFNLDIVYSDYPEAKSGISSSGGDKRLRSNSFEKLPFLFTNIRVADEDLKILGVIKNKRVFRYIPRKYIDFGHENLAKYKVLIPKSNGSGALGEVLSTPMIGTPMIGFTGTFISIGAFEKLDEAEAAMKYVKSKFSRTMLGILKVTQDNPKSTWKYVPLQDFTENSDIDWSLTIPEIDQQLYKKYKLSEEEIKFIESHVQEMD